METPEIRQFRAYLIRNESNKIFKKMVWEDMKKVMAFLGKK